MLLLSFIYYSTTRNKRENYAPFFSSCLGPTCGDYVLAFVSIG